MVTTTLSSKGQVVIPSAVRRRHQWQPGQCLAIEDTADGLILRLPPAGAALRRLVGIAGYKGKAKSRRDMEAAIARGARDHHDGD